MITFLPIGVFIISDLFGGITQSMVTDHNTQRVEGIIANRTKRLLIVIIHRSEVDV